MNNWWKNIYKDPTINKFNDIIHSDILEILDKFSKYITTEASNKKGKKNGDEQMEEDDDEVEIDQREEVQILHHGWFLKFDITSLKHSLCFKEVI